MFSRTDRRTLLRGGGAAAALAAFDGLWQQGRKQGGAGGVPPRGGYGPLRPIADVSTGLPLLQLPEDFRYTSFGWVGDPMFDGSPTPCDHDGMGVVAELDGGRLLLVRNHEISEVGTPFGTSAITYDSVATGGVTKILFDSLKGQHLATIPGLVGTDNNCAGGVTPWRSWITCEETDKGPNQGFMQDHGWAFEVPGLGAASPTPLMAMGRFRHEAVAVDPATNFLYLTEDDTYTSGFYRFRPTATPAELAQGGLSQGGTLEMLKVVGVTNADLQSPEKGDRYAVEWVTIDDPEEPKRKNIGPFTGPGGQTTSASGPFAQAFDKGAARFNRLEGCFASGGLVYFVDTGGGVPAYDTGKPEGALWCYDPQAGEVVAFYVSPAKSVIENPDNVVVSPRGGILLCEDGGLDPERLQGLTPSGDLFLFAQNNIVLNGEKNGLFGDFTYREFAGASFDPSGKWLFVNVQIPGISFAITGPWSRGAL
jgi:secreted PhoX family phosphatase